MLTKKTYTSIKTILRAHSWKHIHLHSKSFPSAFHIIKKPGNPEGLPNLAAMIKKKIERIKLVVKIFGYLLFCDKEVFQRECNFHELQ